MMTALLGLLRKEGYHILRDKRTLAVLILLPIVEVVLFGFAISVDVRNVRVAVVDPTPDANSVALREKLAATPAFILERVLPNTDSLGPLFQSDAIHEALVLPARFGARLNEGQPVTVQVISDATEPNTGTARQSYLTAVIQDYAASLRDSTRLPLVRITPQVRMRFNPTEKSSNLFVPGLMAMVLTIISALMTALSLTREKETGTIEALLVSPLKPWQIVVGKVLPYLVIGFLSVALVIVEAHWVFQVPVKGSVPLLLAEGLLFILVSLSLGVLISARTSSQRVAMMGTLLGTMLPTQMLSGFVFPIDSMPKVLQWVSLIVPARWFVVIARGIMLKGIGLADLWHETLILLAMALVLLALSVRSFDARLS